MTLNYHRRCLKLLPLACMHARHRRDMDEDTLENIRSFTDRSRTDGYLRYQVHFKIDARVVNRGSESFQVLMHPREHLMIRLPPRWISPLYNRFPSVWCGS
ncbi:hypothetical protein TNCV_3463451 [Trichonephila clavipes]|nr:hypothetical protein TNCV_3463451 [Trichonephila clavipes]